MLNFFTVAKLAKGLFGIKNGIFKALILVQKIVLCNSLKCVIEILA
jgi:hypothetical protein